MRREKKYPAEQLEGGKISCPPDCCKKILDDQKSPTPRPQELNGRPLIMTF